MAFVPTLHDLKQNTKQELHNLIKYLNETKEMYNMYCTSYADFSFLSYSL